jgi:hypothetical protein
LQDAAEAFIKRWTENRGGAERANYALFLVELCDLIGVPRPNPAGPETEYNDYVFERSVRFRHDDGSTSPGRIDLYKKGCFVLEAKQSKKREKGGEVYEQLAFALDSGRASGTAVLEPPRGKTRGKPTPLSTWDALMRSARKQAENYARALDEWPPFLVVVDVGHMIELYADFSRQGKNYAQFPDRHAFRIAMEDLRSVDVRERLRCVWENPLSLDPTKHAAEVTQDIAAFLAKMTQTMERRAPSQDQHVRDEWAYKVSKFLMRCIFAMFAEDIGLLPKGAFLKLIEQHKGKANRFHLAANDFFDKMDKGGYSPAIQEDIKRFNGGLFREAISVEINEDELALLKTAARRDWHAVEPAIFGTLRASPPILSFPRKGGRDARRRSREPGMGSKVERFTPAFLFGAGFGPAPTAVERSTRGPPSQAVGDLVGFEAFGAPPCACLGAAPRQPGGEGEQPGAEAVAGREPACGAGGAQIGEARAQGFEPVVEIRVVELVAGQRGAAIRRCVHDFLPCRVGRHDRRPMRAI